MRLSDYVVLGPRLGRTRLGLEKLGLQVHRRQRRYRAVGVKKNACDKLKAKYPSHAWSYDFVRHEAFSDRAEMKDLRGPPVAAVGHKLRAARTGERRDGWGAALTKPGRGSTVRVSGAWRTASDAVGPASDRGRCNDSESVS